jgi:hypothetical protein
MSTADYRAKAAALNDPEALAWPALCGWHVAHWPWQTLRRVAWWRL